MSNLKDYRDKELSLYVIANILLFLIVHKFISIDVNEIATETNVLSEIFASATLSAIAFGFIIVTECLFTSEFKGKLLYLFGILKQPGSTIFTKIKQKNPDNRFSYQTVKDKYPKIYDGLPKEIIKRQRYENEHWYSIYNQCRDTSMILHSQRDWLLFRDIYISTILMITIYVIALVINFVKFNEIYMIYLIIALATTNIGANRKANRFAFNVIAYDLTKPTEKGGK